MRYEAAEHVVVVFRGGLEPVPDDLLRNADDGAHASRVARRGRGDAPYRSAVEELFEPGVVAAQLEDGHEGPRRGEVRVEIFVALEVAEWVAERDVCEGVHGEVLHYG